MPQDAEETQQWQTAANPPPLTVHTIHTVHTRELVQCCKMLKKPSSVK